ncbi:MAG: hypothetical protein ACRDL8_19265 [Solirubrobacteraceae bacterium]
MPEPGFRVVCPPGVLAGSPEWAREMLRDGEIALLADAGGLAAVDELAHALGLTSVTLIRGERSADAQEETVISNAGGLPLVWVGPGFSDRASGWARDRGAMTLLVAADAPLSEDERRRIGRFVAALGRQSE